MCSSSRSAVDPWESPPGDYSCGVENEKTPLAITTRELALIPKGDLAQNTFRMVFQMWRMNSLGSNPEFPSDDLRSVFERAKQSVRATRPDFEPRHDPRLFDN